MVVFAIVMGGFVGVALTGLNARLWQALALLGVVFVAQTLLGQEVREVMLQTMVALLTWVFFALNRKRRKR